LANAARQSATRAASSTEVTTTTATFVGLASAGALGRVVIDGETLEFPIVGYYMPREGDVVRLFRFGREAYIFGPVVQKPAEGTIVSVQVGPSGFVEADVETSAFVVHPGLRVFDAITNPRPGDRVALDWALGGVVIGRFSRTLSAPAPAPAPAAGLTDSQEVL
jgi:hypothetical protein